MDDLLSQKSKLKEDYYAVLGCDELSTVRICMGLTKNDGPDDGDRLQNGVPCTVLGRHQSGAPPVE